MKRTKSNKLNQSNQLWLFYYLFGTNKLTKSIKQGLFDCLFVSFFLCLFVCLFLCWFVQTIVRLSDSLLAYFVVVRQRWLIAHAPWTQLFCVAKLKRLGRSSRTLFCRLHFQLTYCAHAAIPVTTTCPACDSMWILHVLILHCDGVKYCRKESLHRSRLASLPLSPLRHACIPELHMHKQTVTNKQASKQTNKQSKPL